MLAGKADEKNERRWTQSTFELFSMSSASSFAFRKTGRDNGNVHRAAAKDMQAEKAARPAAPCATYCYHALELPANYALCVQFVRAVVCMTKALSINSKWESSQF
jgi:hypothetical protein